MRQLAQAEPALLAEPVGVVDPNNQSTPHTCARYVTAAPLAGTHSRFTHRALKVKTRSLPAESLVCGSSRERRAAVARAQLMT
jgi:hypothetical protein